MLAWLQRVLARPTEEVALEAAPAREPVPSAPVPETPPVVAERRSCARVNLELQVRLRFESAEALIACRTFDISRNGAFIAVRKPRPRGTRVRLTIVVDNTTIVVGGVVVRVSDGAETGRAGMGIQFQDVSSEAARALASLLGPRGG